jgi:predicted nucleic acid-binding protein
VISQIPGVASQASGVTLIYGADKDAPDHARCRELLESFRPLKTPWYVTWGIVYEFLRVVTHPRVLSRPLTPQQAWMFIDAMFASPFLDTADPATNDRRTSRSSLRGKPRP